MPLKNSRIKGTANKYDGRLDYDLPVPPWEGDTGFYLQDSTISNATLLSLAGSGLPINIRNFGGPDDLQRSDDSTVDGGDGFAYDVLIWELDDSVNVGFGQKTYFFREAPIPVGETGSISPQTVSLALGGSIKTATILIEDASYPAVTKGSGGADAIAGTEKSDGIFGDAGDDVIDGLENNDSLIGGEGNDLINGGSDSDVVVGNEGNDQLYGEAGGDRLSGLEGNDSLYGNSGNDILSGSSGDDSLYGGTGSDRLSGGSGQDRLLGNSGDDLYVLDDAGDGGDQVIELANQGIDTVQAAVSYTLPDHVEHLQLLGSIASSGTGNSLDNNLTGNAASNLLVGGEGNDILNGDDRYGLTEGSYVGSADTLQGGAGNDTLIGWFDSDTLTGGSGADRFIFAGTYSGYSPATNDGVDVITDFSRIQGDKVGLNENSFNFSAGPLPATAFRIGAAAISSGTQIIYNSATGDLFYDFDGLGGFAQIKIAVLSGAPTLTSSDIVIVDEIFSPSSSAIDSTISSSQSWTGTAAADRLIGREGADSIAAEAGNDLVFGLEGNDTLSGGGGNDRLNGGSGNDTINGDAGSDQLYGEAGEDRLSGGRGNDTLRGGTGNDILTGNEGSDRFNFFNPALDGIDTITDFDVTQDIVGIYVGNSITRSVFQTSGLAVNSPIAANQFRVGLQAASSSDRLIYNSSTGALFFDADGTGAAAQVQIAQISTGLALTSANFFACDDSNLNAPPEPINQTGTAGDDTLLGDERNNLLVGLEGNDLLSGEAGNDTLEGGRGSDRLYSGPGSDRLKGGRGRDLFVLEKGAGRDIIQDFSDRVDRLGLADGLKFRRLTITQKGQNTLISFRQDPLALLIGVRARQLTAADFTAVSSIL